MEQCRSNQLEIVMREYIFAVLAVTSLILTGNLLVLGLDWIEIGHGLNPWVAFPGAVLFACIAIFATRVLLADDTEIEEYKPTVREYHLPHFTL